MTEEKFKSEIDTLNDFFIVYCKDKHPIQNKCTISSTFNNKTFNIQTEICAQCKELLEHACNNISLCPHEIKPRCRKCPNPCYEKSEWKRIAKIMRYSGIKLGLIKIRDMLFK